MKRIALVLHENGDIAPVDDDARHFDRVEIYELDELSEHKVVQPFDPKASDFDLAEAAALAGVTDVIGQHFEQQAFEKLKARGIHVWLEAPENKAGVALEAWKAGELPEAKAGSHAVHGPEGGRETKEGQHPRHAQRSARPDRGVSSPAHGPKI
jgi:predicted Fe-Mo cluster-binding NifX family protein